MFNEEILWKVNQPEKVTSLLRAYKHLASIDEVITILIRPKRIDFFSESQDNSAALICTFHSSFFNDFRGSSTRVFATFSKNLTQITEAHKQGILSIISNIRKDDFLDIGIEYNSGVVAHYGCPFTDKIHEICQAGGPELPLYPSWIGDHYVFWDERLLKLFPGNHEYMAMKLTSQGIEVRDFDLEKNQTGRSGRAIKIPRAKIQVYEPQKEIEITSIPFQRLKTFLESSKKCKFFVQMSPEFNENTSQTFWQCFDEKKNTYFTLLLGCDVSSGNAIKKDIHDDTDISFFRQLD